MRHACWRHGAPALLMVATMGAACQSSSDEGSGPGVARYAVAPPALDIMVGQTMAVTIAALSARGDTVLVGARIDLFTRGSAGLSILGCDRVGEHCSVTGVSSGVDTIGLDIGNYGRCLDGPDCTAREWHSDTLITIPATVR